ncbi:hypothetical protein [Salinivibrio sp. YCSC6]|uniref:hypothetical protein n=1 Tax=Salinivibrio sp. YCSC6 TaxID=2003370 RepID=UPI000BBCE960|nr:hypothetical protein [Salinivibrio sp. YCSC6]PCE67550.1 hypothetical protein B6G00_04170 [Salinivibrio sp. YCSC6]QCF35543.1 hypothetical protein E8E00_04780 [Salinivibrio sp. YCSC6]
MKDLKSMQSYIETLELATLDSAVVPKKAARRTLAVTKDDKESANVSANSVVSFTKDLPEQLRADVLNSTLFAQLAATAKFNPETDPKGWYQKYNEVLNNIGWNFPSWDFSKVQTSSKGFEISKEVIKLIQKVDVSAAGMMSAVLESLSASDNSDAADLFDSVSNPKEDANFQIGPCAYSGKNVVMTSACMFFKATEHVHRFLWFTWKDQSTELWGSARKAELVDDVYARVRNQIIEKLGNRAEKYVMDIDLGDFDTKYAKHMERLEGVTA